MAIVALIGLPALERMIHRSRIESFHTQTASIMQLARHEAIRRHVPAVVAIDLGRNQILAFADVNVDGEFNPDPGKKHRETDYPIGVPFGLPRGLFFWAPEDPQPATPGNPQNAIKDFTAASGGAPNQAVFTQTGAVEDTGAFRFGDEMGNFLEIRVSPRASGRIQLRKWDPDAAEFFARGEDGRNWKWY